jgi:hypothetical protein
MPDAITSLLHHRFFVQPSHRNVKRNSAKKQDSSFLEKSKKRIPQVTDGPALSKLALLPLKINKKGLIIYTAKNQQHGDKTR